MTEKNNNKQNKNEFLEAKMYYYNTDALTERDHILNSKKLKQSVQKQASNKKIKKLEIKESLVPEFKDKTQISLVKDSNQEIVLERLSSLEHIYKQLAEKLNLSRVSLEVEAVQENNEKLEDQINQLEQERLTLLEQITSLEEQIVFSAQIETEKNELKDQVSLLNIEKKKLEKIVTRLTNEMNNYSQTVSTIENNKSIVYLSKEREILDNKIAVLNQEKRELYLQLQKINLNKTDLEKQNNLLEEKVKAVAYLDKKSAMFEEDVKELERKNHLLNEKVNYFSEKNDKLSKENKNLVFQQEILNNKIKDQSNWQEKIDCLEFEKNNQAAIIKQLGIENQNLIQVNKKKDKDVKVDEQKQRLIDRVDQLEEERIHLFKIVGELEAASKVAPDINKKNELLQEELTELKNDNAQAKKQLTEFIKNAKIMQTEIIQLKDKKVTRLELEQEKGKMQKRINDLEDQTSILLNEISCLNQKISDSQINNTGFENLRRELAKFEAEKTELLTQLENDKKQIIKLTEIISNEKNIEIINEGKIVELCNENKKLSEQMKIMQISQPVNYILDMEKLEELKEFVLESIQTRRWKSTEFVNGAYDAVGLFYRTILNERPLKPNK